MTGYRLGVALPGSRTSAAILDPEGRVVVTVELGSDTPGDVLDAVLDAAEPHGIRAGDIDHVMFAVTDLRVMNDLAAETGSWRGWPGRLARVAAVRLGAATTSVPPLTLWPQELQQRVVVASTCLSGGAMLDGSDYEPLDFEGLQAFARQISGVAGAVAITGVFSAVTPRHELAAAEVLRAEMGACGAILLSHEYGGLGLVERENATILQAALTAPVAEEAAKLLNAVNRRGMNNAEVFLARSDGTIATLDNAVTHPLSLLGATDATAVVGASVLAGEKDALVGLTNVDGSVRAVCALTDCGPRMTVGQTKVAGVPTGLSVPALVPIHASVEEAIDRAKEAPGDLPLLLVGPGARTFVKSLKPQSPRIVGTALAGTVKVESPVAAEAAAAVGAAAAPVVGEARRIVPLNSPGLEEIRAAVREAARASAMRAGADPANVSIVSADEKPLAYLSEPTVVMRVRAGGPPRDGGTR
ncbi:hydantoinase/oxoprolinase N-terminal domain-containing protein [Kibdelosporangium persicum]|uniref:N-methylhydantoinase (ATP-hydrolyzing) n=1 Tax=Kibdelosporangium persicum TaxID=2698649 RepID=A0ABX2F3F3_9PSEU|nr:hydantoinase/oxoprolinase N-terminal domain-containing protein [Kibdelosporangium persicum]NRN65860.1 N-methylhydantoinase (ATP-hydrolyzing) [Kibdelosporangium persicum]